LQPHHSHARNRPGPITSRRALVMRLGRTPHAPRRITRTASSRDRPGGKGAKGRGPREMCGAKASARRWARPKNKCWTRRDARCTRARERVHCGALPRNLLRVVGARDHGAVGVGVGVRQVAVLRTACHARAPAGGVSLSARARACSRWQHTHGAGARGRAPQAATDDSDSGRRSGLAGGAGGPRGRAGGHRLQRAGNGASVC